MRYLVIGGTGTLGSALLQRLERGGEELICFSRDELKQQQLRAIFPRVKYMLGDVRDRASLRPAMVDVETVFHVAALKHVDVLEDNPVEAIKTNILGTINVAEAAAEAGVRHVVFSSTDKAVLPVNTYGMTKGISERYLLSLNKLGLSTKFAVYRWGNVLGSRGSVIHSFEKSIKAAKAVTVTDPRMTRFWIHIDDAVTFLLETYRQASPEKVMVPSMKAASVTDIAEGLARIHGLKKLTINFSGLRPGEKIHECLESSHDFCVRSDTAERYSKSELEELLRRVVG